MGEQSRVFDVWYRREKYLIHRAVYETYNGPIRDGLIIDHIDSCPQKNKLSNLQAITPSQNAEKGKTEKCAKFARPVRSFDIVNNEELVFQSIAEAGRYFNICRGSIIYIAEGIYQTAFSKRNGHIIQFSYI